MKITVEMDADTGIFQLWVSGGGMGASPAGPRLFRANPVPEIRFQHADLESAEKDAKKLSVYLGSLVPTKRMTKNQIAEAFR